MKTTLNAIRAHNPCANGWKNLLTYLGKTTADDEPLSIAMILDSNGLDDALWCLCAVNEHDREIRLYAVWCARQVQHLMTDPRSLAALNVAERYANGTASDSELDAAWDAAEDVVWDAAGDTAGGAAGDAAWAAVWAAARDAAWAAAQNAAGGAAGAAARDAAQAAAQNAAWAAARDAAWAAARTAQSAELRRVCAEIDAGRDPYPETVRFSHDDMGRVVGKEE